MKRRLILAVSFFVLFGCKSSRTVNRDKTEATSEVIENSVKKSDSLKIVKKDLNYIFIKKDVSFVPIDNDKPMTIEGKEYKNVKISSKDENTIDKTKIAEITALKKSNSTNVSKKDKISLNVKKTQSEGNNVLILYAIIAVLVAIIIYIKKPSF